MKACKNDPNLYLSSLRTEFRMSSFCIRVRWSYLVSISGDIGDNKNPQPRLPLLASWLLCGKLWLPAPKLSIQPLFDKTQQSCFTSKISAVVKTEKGKIMEKLLKRQQNLHNWNWLRELLWELKKMPCHTWVIKNKTPNISNSRRLTAAFRCQKPFFLLDTNNLASLR